MLTRLLCWIFGHKSRLTPAKENLWSLYGEIKWDITCARQGCIYYCYVDWNNTIIPKNQRF